MSALLNCFRRGLPLTPTQEARAKTSLLQFGLPAFAHSDWEERETKEYPGGAFKTGRGRQHGTVPSCSRVKGCLHTRWLPGLEWPCFVIGTVSMLLEAEDFLARSIRILVSLYTEL